MEGRVIAVLVAAAVLGLVPIILAFVGEATRIKEEQVSYSPDDGFCYYPPTPAMALGIVAAILLLIHHILISVGGRCFCCSSTTAARPSTCPAICSIICFVFSWLAFVGAFNTLITAAVLNNMYFLIKHYATDDNPCPAPNPGLFAGAGVLCLFSVALSFISYILFICTDRTHQSTDHVVAMAQPQLPKQQV